MSLPRPKGLPRRIPKWAIPWARWVVATAPWRLKHKRKPKPPAPPVPVEMYDDINVSLIPVNAEAVAGYVDGKWPTYAQLVKKFPHAKFKLSIAVFASDNADVLDVEPGDATVGQTAAWLVRQHAAGNKLPDVYTSASWGNALNDALARSGFVLGKDYRWWSAHYTGQPHLCNPKCFPGLRYTAQATQWTDKAGGRSLDESVCSAEFFA